MSDGVARMSAYRTTARTLTVYPRASLRRRSLGVPRLLLRMIARALRASVRREVAIVTARVQSEIGSEEMSDLVTNTWRGPYPPPPNGRGPLPVNRPE